MEFVSGIWNLRLPAKVAKSMRFTVFLRAWGRKNISFTVVLATLVGSRNASAHPANPGIQYRY